MRKLWIGLAFAWMMVACDEDTMTGDLDVTVSNNVVNVVNIRLFGEVSFNSGHVDSNDAIASAPLLGGKATFNNLNPGNYVVAVDVQPIGHYQAVQVAPGKRAAAFIE